MALHLLTDGDVEVLKGLIAREKARLSNVPNRPVAYNEDEYHQAPECYIALVPPEGIPALNRQLTTGSGDEVLDDVPGSAECNIYQLVDDAFVRVEGLTKLVYNLSSFALAPNEWIKIERDKFGTWLASSLMAIEVQECQPDTGTGT